VRDEEEGQAMTAPRNTLPYDEPDWRHEEFEHYALPEDVFRPVEMAVYTLAIVGLLALAVWMYHARGGKL
jgi:hypothetical protein